MANQLLTKMNTLQNTALKLDENYKSSIFLIPPFDPFFRQKQ